jgi:IS5 family transposase
MKTFFDERNRLERLTELGDPLEKLSLIDFEIFRKPLNRLIPSYDNRLGDRQKLDRVMMFKVLILGQLNTLADDRLEYLINDRLSFQRFLGLELGDKVPDAKSIWKFREDLKNSGGFEELFNLFTKVLEEKRIVTNTGSIIDSTIYVRQPPKYTKPLSGIDDQKLDEESSSASTVSNTKLHSERQRDRDSRWTVKGEKFYFGYKNHIKVDVESKIITKVVVKPAN